MPQGQQEAGKNYAPYVNSDLFIGTVTSCDPATHCVVVSPDGESGLLHYQAHCLASTYSSALGFVESILPGVGTRVLCFGRGDSTAVIGAFPNHEAHGTLSAAALANKTVLASSEPINDSVHSFGYASHITKAAVHNNNLPTDTIQGEKVIANEFGVMMGLFKLFATLRASELSQVQCHFLDDLVRIISHNFQHYTALGELKVFHDGKGIHLEVGATHSPDESMGNAQDPSIIQIGKETDTDYQRFYKLNDSQANMLERMKLFVGKLGDFINLLIVKPANVSHAFNGNVPTQPDTGLLQVKASLDGTLVIRSANGIYLEKTDWIRVPTRIRTAEDPNGDDGATLGYTEKTDYTFDETYVTADAAYNDTAFLYYLQLRDYLAYINEEIGYSNFKKHEKDFYVNDDIAKEADLANMTFVDPLTGSTFKKNKSWIALMKNGGVSLADAWGSSINMEGGNIYIQPAKDLIVQPNRNLIAKVGKNVSIAAQNELDLSSTSGGLRVKTNLSQYFYSDKSGIVLHANGPDLSENTYPYPDSDAIAGVAGVVFNAPKSSVSAYGQQVNLQAKFQLVEQAAEIISHSTSRTRILSDQQALVSAPFAGVFAKQELTIFSDGGCIAMGLGSTTVGLEGQVTGIVNFMGGQIPVNGYIKSSDQFITDIKKTEKDVNDFKPAEVLQVFQSKDDFNLLQFKFLPTSLYNLEDSDVIPQTLSQQNDTKMNGLLQKWVETPINDSYPYPGSDKAESYVTAESKNVSDMTLANKAVDLLNNSTLAVKNVFSDYKSY
jgi:hypothetical protein